MIERLGIASWLFCPMLEVIREAFWYVLLLVGESNASVMRQLMQTCKRNELG